ncbi:MAG: hypothetical protein WBA11_04965, partial [Rubrivirga sp.]
PEPPSSARVAYVEAAPASPALEPAPEGDFDDAAGIVLEDVSDPDLDEDLSFDDVEVGETDFSSFETELDEALVEDETPERGTADVLVDDGPIEDEVTQEPGAPASDADDLDSLIAQLDEAPRIRPDPTYDGPEVSLDTPEVDDLASETLAKIYAAQHQYVEAAVIYEKLAARQPDQADELLDRAAELRRRG